MKKFFKKCDIIIYAIILIIVVVLFLVFLLPKNSKVKYFEIYYKNEMIYIYDCELKSGKILSPKCLQRVEENGKTTVTVQHSGCKNVILIENNTVKMVESNCSGQECVHNFQRITSVGDVIICVPNNLKIVAKSDSTNIPFIPSGKRDCKTY
ncbi:MAG: NusG domain II-containing protein [Clostridia bacterium]